MAKGFSKEEGEAKNARIGEIIEGAITALEGVGLSHEDALRGLIIQSMVRMDDSTEALHFVKSTLDAWAGRFDEQPYEQ